MLIGLYGSGAERVLLNLASALIARGHRADLAIPRLAGDYQAATLGGMRIRRARLPGTDGRLLRVIRRAGVDVEVMTANPVGAARSWLVLAHRDTGATRQRHALHLSLRPFSGAIHARSTPPCWCRRCRAPTPSRSCAAELTARAVPVVSTVHSNVATEYTPEWLDAARTLYLLADAVVAVPGAWPNPCGDRWR